MKNKGLLDGIYGLTPPVAPTSYLSDLLGFGNPPPVAPPVPSPYLPKIGSPLANDSSPLSFLASSPYAPVAPPSSGQFRSLADLVGATQPPAVPAPQGIKFNDLMFTEPRLLSGAVLPAVSGLYAVLVFDWSGSPRPYRPIYFGKASDIAARVNSRHENHSTWCGAAGGAGNLYVACRPMVRSSDWQRSELEEALIKTYTPRCNDIHNPLSGLLGF